MNPEDIPSDAIIEHEQGSVPEREIREPVAKYGSKKKKQEILIQVQQPPPVGVTTLPPVQIVAMQHHQTIDPHAAAMWAYAQRAQDMRTEQDQSSNSNY